MLKHLHIAAGGFEGIFWLLVVIVTIVTQRIKASKRSREFRKEGSETPQDTQTDYAPEEGQLREFLETLAGGGHPQAEIQPPPVPPTLPVNEPAVEPTALYSEGPVQLTEVTPPPHAPRAPSQRPKPGPRVSPKPPADAVDSRAMPSRELFIETKLMKEIRREFTKPRSLWKAVILREILGPPLAFQRGPSELSHKL